MIVRLSINKSLTSRIIDFCPTLGIYKKKKKKIIFGTWPITAFTKGKIGI